jgi:gamma-glutamylcyclotransferase (GGCT)/AIG2-like uncharacterized protein YtfP
MQECYHLFVYGSLRSGFRSPAYEYISRYFDLEGEAKVKGDLYDMGNYAAGVPTEDERYIHGELYRVREEPEFDWAIAQLDDYEGVTVEADEIQLYRRALTEVFINGNTTISWIYWFNGDTTGKTLVESGDMLSYLMKKIKS